MHMSDALVAPVVAATMYAASAVVVGYAIKRFKREDDQKQIPVMGVLGAFVFAVQMVNFSIPGTGASGHLTGGLLLSSLLGPYAAFLTMTGILIVQSLLFADGGLLALGCNIWNMAFYSCFVGALIIWQFITRNGISRRRIVIASILGSVVSLQLGAFSVAVETTASGITELPFRLFVTVMQPVHLAIGMSEGIITAAILSFVYRVRPELLWTGKQPANSTSNSALFSGRQIIVTFLIAFVIVGGCLTLLASSSPDGLEWSVNRVAGEKSIHSTGVIYTISEKIRGLTSLFPDYTVAGKDTHTGTSLSGLIGGVLVMILLGIVSRLIRQTKRGRK